MTNFFKYDSLTGKISFGKWIDIISRHLSYYIVKNLKKYNLNRNEYKYLIQIYIREGFCQEDMVERLKVDKYEVAKSVKSLIEKGYIYKTKDEEDRRKYRLFLTDKAKEIKSDFIHILEQSSEVLTRNFSEKEKQLLLDFLFRMTENIYEETTKLKNQ
ncbi:MarR family winged helix-turn-helix transcriptional regulator [Haloimpatiens sp. FM7330]|uniref:MarR family winged helix-turn-helix transcriptional regulator n=1 Tax=Haloimpatiens sp. FM7330 TaxID=3298610 RepID=UPI003632EEBC